MKSNNLIALYNEFGNLVGYFHDDKEVEEYINFLNSMNIKTDGWKRNDNQFKV